MKKQFELKSGAILMCTAIILGAFGAHSLEKELNDYALDIFETGVRYQTYHGLGLLIIGLISIHITIKPLVGKLMLMGTIFFSGSIYLLVLGKLNAFDIASYIWWVPPLGGILLALSWGLLLKEIIIRK